MKINEPASQEFVAMTSFAPLRSVLLTLLCTFGFLLVLAAPAVSGLENEVPVVLV